MDEVEQLKGDLYVTRAHVLVVETQNAQLRKILETSERLFRGDIERQRQENYTLKRVLETISRCPRCDVCRPMAKGFLDRTGQTIDLRDS